MNLFHDGEPGAMNINKKKLLCIVLDRFMTRNAIKMYVIALPPTEIFEETR